VKDIMARTAIITGGAGGLGLAMARGLMADGHRVALIDSDGDAIARARDALHGGETLGAIADVSDEAAVAAAVETVVAAFGPVEILINNAGIGPSSVRPDAERNLPGVMEVTPELWARFFAVNLTGAMLMLRAVLPGMQAGGWGRVVNNTTSFFTMLRVLPYGATKAALESASAVWAKELDGSGVTVNVVVPGGPTDTAFISDEAGINRAKMLQPEVMAPPLRWLASDRSSAATGRRFVAALWDPDLPADEAAEISGTPIGWPELAAATVVWPDD
jgi:NAD(P)-dependent dehydrogenase (short-subunit alcohol dehydrogenase family)